MRAAVALLLVACSAPRTVTDVSYDDRFGAATTLDLYLPGGEARPAVLLVHGGSWRTGFKEQFRDVAVRLARSGWAAVAVNYRLGPEGAFPAAAQDVGCALAWLQAHAGEYGIDPARVALMGYSSGGHLVSLVALGGPAPDCAAGTPAPPAAVVSGSAMEDLFALADLPTVQEFLGGTAAERPEVYAAASPLRQVRAGAPPFLLLHGDDDGLVPVEQSARMRDALRAAGGAADLLVVGGGGHLFNPGPDGGSLYVEIATDEPEAWLAIADFLDRILGPR